MTWLLCFALTLGTPSLAAESAGYGQAQDYDSLMAQARLFVKKGWYGDAADQLEAAFATGPGSQSFEAHWLAAQVAFELLDIDWALATSRRAMELAPDEERRSAAAALVESYEQGFGFVVVNAPYEGMSTRMQIELTSLVFDPELKRYINRCALAWRGRSPLPARLGLPVGSYIINGQPVDVSPNTESALDLPMSAIGARGMAALQVTRAELSGGLGFFTGDRMGRTLPGPHIELSITQPLGPILVGLMADYSVLAFTEPDGQTHGGLSSWGAGLRLGAEPASRLPLAIRPSLTARYVRVPGVPLACQTPEQPEATAAACTAPTDNGTELMRVYAVGQAIAPGAELSVEYRQAGRTTALGTGLKVGVDYAIGSFPDDGDDAITDDPSVAWTAEGQRWSALGVRLLANLSVAF